MKKFVLFFLTSITSVWFIDLLLSGFKFKGSEITVFLVALFLVVGIYFAERVSSKFKQKQGGIIFLVISIVLNFFSLYLASLVLEKFSISSGSLSDLDLGIFKTPVVRRIDLILSLILGSLFASLIGMITRWAIGSSKKSES